MASTLSVSKGCFIFKPKDEKSKKKRKTTSCLDFSSEAWYRCYTKLWKKIEKKLEEINENVSQGILEDLAEFIAKCDTVDGKISSAALLLGVNMPDHATLFTALANRIRASVTPHVAILESIDFTTVRSAIEKMVSLLVKEKTIDADDIDKMSIDSSSDEEDDSEKVFKKSDCNLPSLFSWYKEKYSCKAGQSDSPKLIVMLTDFEGTSAKVLEDFILILSQYAGRLPLVMIMGVATTASAIHRSLSHSATLQLSLRLFQSQPSVYFLNNTLDKVFLKYDCPFQLGSKVMKLLTDIFLFYDFSVDGFIKGIKCNCCKL